MNKSQIGKRSRSAGIKWERQIIKELKSMGFNAVSSRQESRSQDAAGNDIISDCNFNIQCKCSCVTPNINILSSMPDNHPPVILWKKTKRVDKNFKTIGEYAILKKEDFLIMLANIRTYDNLLKEQKNKK